VYIVGLTNGTTLRGTYAFFFGGKGCNKTQIYFVMLYLQKKAKLYVIAKLFENLQFKKVN
jgi:hypothetical protein